MAMREVKSKAELHALRLELSGDKHLVEVHEGEKSALAGAYEYVAILFDSTVILGRFSTLNKDRVIATLHADVYKSALGEDVNAWQTGTRDELLATFPDAIPADVFDQADDAYRANPQHQISFERID